MEKSAPCKNCPDRHLACHDECKKYQEYKEHNESRKAEYNRYKELQSIRYGYNKNKTKGFSFSKHKTY